MSNQPPPVFILEKNGSQIGLNQTWTRVRAGGMGLDAWVALITGFDKAFRFERKFCPRDESKLSNSGSSGSIEFAVRQPGIYEFRNFCIGTSPRRGLWSGFFEILPDGQIRSLTLAKVTERLKATQPGVPVRTKRKRLRAGQEGT